MMPRGPSVLNHLSILHPPGKEKTLRSGQSWGQWGRRMAARCPRSGRRRRTDEAPHRPRSPHGTAAPPTHPHLSAGCPERRCAVVPDATADLRRYPGAARRAQTPRVAPGEGARGAGAAWWAHLSAGSSSQAAAPTRPAAKASAPGKLPPAAGPRPASPAWREGRHRFRLRARRPSPCADPRGPRRLPRPDGRPVGPAASSPVRPPARPPVPRLRSSAPRRCWTAGRRALPRPGLSLGDAEGRRGGESGGGGGGSRGSGGRGRGSSTGTGGGGAHAHARSRTHPHRRARPRKNVGSAGRSRGRGRRRTRPER